MQANHSYTYKNKFLLKILIIAKIQPAYPSFVSLCMYVCVHASIHVWECTCRSRSVCFCSRLFTYVCTQSPVLFLRHYPLWVWRLGLGSVCLVGLLVDFWNRTSHWPEVYRLARICLSLSPPVLGLGCSWDLPHPAVFYIGSGDQTPVLMLPWCGVDSPLKDWPWTSNAFSRLGAPVCPGL